VNQDYYFLFFDITTEQEDIKVNNDSSDDDDGEENPNNPIISSEININEISKENMDLINKYKQSTKKYEHVNFGADSEILLTNNYDELTDTNFLYFQKEMEKYPNQVLRYSNKKKNTSTMG